MVSQQESLAPRTDPDTSVASRTKFLPTEKAVDTQESVAGFFDQVKTNKLEIDMYQPFIDVIKPYLRGFKVENTSVMSSTVQMGENQLKPDVAIYADDSERKDEKRTDFSAIEICIELKRSALHDPFDDADGAPFEKNTELGMSMRGQITSYATAHLGKQFRLFTFLVIIIRDMARIMHWERAGSTITNAFNYKQNPEFLINFFRRFASLSRKDRGWDTSVIPIDEAQPPSDIHSDTVRATDGPSTGESLEFHYYIGGRPPCPYSLIGRSTRGWPVFCVATQQVVFLKDTWRIDSDDIEPEGVTYRKLHEKNVHNIATVEASGDVVTDE
ncbi:hypothetical protein SCLCIDRAFT_10810 [Scleroderma citrinum Foug A]|uniref:Fungal-type protein kinase domain-containing protein n=1 Tax=Scleroderma citrinum Foug A TaxID=1036808 RepID=A0A0C2ZU73_9AGAM|nr:hypothetical protein SCLCIDRAFT_10810 [Scleroderma citrinum Foug A]